VNTPFTFSFTTDTTLIDTSSNTETGGTVYQTAFVPGAVTIDGMSGAFSTGVSVQVNYPYINFDIAFPGGDFTLIGGLVLPSGYNLLSSIGPATLAQPGLNINLPPFGASFGTVTITSVLDATFSATLSTPTIALAHLPAGNVWTTGIFVINTAPTSSNYSIAFRDDNGNPVLLPFSSGPTSSLSGTLPPLGSAYVEAASAQAALAVGWGLITADPGIVVQALFRDSTNGTYYEAAVPSQQATGEFEMPFDATTFTPSNVPLYTGIAVANTDPSNPATLTCTATDGSGNVIPNGLTVPVIPALGHWSNYLFPALTGLRGTIDCVSTTNVVAIALRFIGTSAFSSLPVILK
jgi:hypothetical protein